MVSNLSMGWGEFWLELRIFTPMRVMPGKAVVWAKLQSIATFWLVSGFPRIVQFVIFQNCAATFGLFAVVASFDSPERVDSSFCGKCAKSFVFLCFLFAGFHQGIDTVAVVIFFFCVF